MASVLNKAFSFDHRDDRISCVYVGNLCTCEMRCNFGVFHLKWSFIGAMLGCIPT